MQYAGVQMPARRYVHPVLPKNAPVRCQRRWGRWHLPGSAGWRAQCTGHCHRGCQCDEKMEVTPDKQRLPLQFARVSS